MTFRLSAITMGFAPVILRRLRPPESPEPRQEVAVKKDEAHKRPPRPKDKGRRDLSIPNPFSRSIVTISIEGMNIRTLVTRGKTVKSWSSIPFNPRFLRNGFISDTLGMGQVFAAGLASKKISKGRTVCAMPGLQAITRVMVMPRIGKAGLQQMVIREARRLLPIAVESNHVYWQIVEERPTQLVVFVLALPKEPLNALVEAMRAGGLKPSSMDLKPLALARAINVRNAVIANGECNSIDFLIVAEHVPVMVRSIYLGDDAATMDQVGSRLMEEVARDIAFYNDTNKDNPLDPAVPVYITGDVASVPGIAENLAVLTGRAVPPLVSPFKSPPDFPLAQYIVNIGLALKK